VDNENSDRQGSTRRYLSRMRAGSLICSLKGREKVVPLILAFSLGSMHFKSTHAVLAHINLLCFPQSFQHDLFILPHRFSI
jgi:hypothetical protein